MEVPRRRPREQLAADEARERVCALVLLADVTTVVAKGGEATAVAAVVVAAYVGHCWEREGRLWMSVGADGIGTCYGIGLP